MTRRLITIIGAFSLAIAVPVAAQEDRAWIEQSNAYTMQLLELQAQFGPEGASQTGLEQYDGLALDLGPNLPERVRAAESAKLAEFRAAQARETNPLIKQDLQILIDSIEDDIEGSELGQRLQLTWVDVPQLVFGNMEAHALEEDRIAVEQDPCPLHS